MGTDSEPRLHRCPSVSFVVKLCLLLLGGFGLRAETLTLATYNVENYTLADRMVEGVYRQEYPKPEAEKEALRAVVRALDADVLALQEIGGPAFLEELRRDLAHEGAGYPHAAIFVHGEAPRYVAVLSRRPFTAIEKHADLTFRYFNGVERVRRGLLEVRLSTAAGEIALFVVHLKSRFTERQDDPASATRRAGEAMAIRDRVLARFPEPASSRFVILGDFNDGPTARPVKAMLTRGQTRIAELLPATDSRGETWTHCYAKEDSYSRVDHILVSPGLLGEVRARAARIHDGPGVRAASDHRPVVTTLEW